MTAATAQRHKISTAHRRTLTAWAGAMGWNIIRSVIDGASFTGSVVREAVALQDFLEALVEHDGFKKELEDKKPADTAKLTTSRLNVLLGHINPVGWTLVQQCLDTASFSGSIAREIVECQDKVAAVIGHPGYQKKASSGQPAPELPQNGAKKPKGKTRKRKVKTKTKTKTKATSR